MPYKAALMHRPTIGGSVSNADHSIHFLPDLPIPLIDAWQVDLRDKLYCRRNIGVIGTAVNVEAVYAVFMHALGSCQGLMGDAGLAGLTWGGPRIVPFQLDKSKSSPLVNP